MKLGGSFEGSSGGCSTTTLSGLSRCLFQQCCDALVGLERGGRQVPGGAVRLVAQRLGQKQVCRARSAKDTEW